MKLVWKLKLDNEARQLHNLFAPMIVSDVRTTTGPKQIGVVAGVSDNVYGIDLDTGTQLWKRTFDNTFTGQANARYYTLCPGGLTATPVIGPGSKPGQFIVYAVSWDGRLRQLDVATGQDAAPPELFLPPNGKPYGLNLYKNVVYTTTAQGCGGTAQPVLRVRPGDEEGRQLQPGQRRHVAAARPDDRPRRQRLRRQR